MFEQLEQYPLILVTGPHRSGTTICAKMIGHDTGHDVVLEDEFYYSRLPEFAAFCRSDYGPRVIQCPFLCHIVHDLGHEIGLDMSRVLVVMMHRYRQDIIDSEERATLKDGRKVDFAKVAQGQKRKYHSGTEAHISDLRYEAWQDQCGIIPHALDVGYESLRDHPLWVDKREFTLRQTSDSDESDVLIRKNPMNPVFVDGLRALQNI